MIVNYARRIGAASGYRVWLAAFAWLALSSGMLRAQSVDYGSLEQIFGEPITTSATGKPQRASEVPADMVILTQDQIRRSGATDIPAILQFVTGIDIRRYNFADTQVGVRGYDIPLNPRLLVLVDGRQVYSDIFGFEAWNTIPVQLSEIRQIEVVRGPNSALFGFNAVSGVVNIITFDPLLDRTNSATLRGGTQGYGEGELVATQHIGSQAGIRVSAGGWTATGFDQPVPTSTPSPRYASFNVDTRWQVTPWLLLNASGGYTDAHTIARLPIEVTQNFRDHISFLRMGAKAQTTIGNVAFDLYRNQEQHTTSADQTNKTIVAKIDDVVKLDADNTVRLGFEYRNNAVASPILYGGRISYDNFAANGMWDWQISPVYEWTNAIRIDHLELHHTGSLIAVTPLRDAATFNSATITEPSFNTGLVIHLSDIDTLRVTAARGLQVPSLADFGLQLKVGRNVYALGSPTALPESVWNAEIAYDRAMPSLGASLQTALFFQRNTDILAPPGSARYAPIGGVIGSPVINFGSSNEIGFEVGAHGTTDGGLRWNASYRYANITQDETGAIAQSQATDFVHGTPVHAIIAGLGYTRDRWEFDVAGRFQSKFTDYIQSPARKVLPVLIPAYVTFNARLGYNVTDYLTIAGTAEQFNVSRLLEGSLQYVDRRLIASATLKY